MEEYNYDRSGEAFDFVLNMVRRIGFGDIAGTALALGPHPVGTLVLGADEDYRDIFGCGIFLKLAARAVTVKIFHNNIHKDNVRLLRPGDLNGVGT